MQKQDRSMEVIMTEQERYDIQPEDKQLTLAVLRSVLPKGRRHCARQGLVDKLNMVMTEPEERDVFRENLLGFSSVMANPRVTMTSYVNAVRYVSYKLLGYTNQECWIKTFPDRYNSMLRKKKSADFIRSIVACYNRNSTVNKILEQTLVPAYVLNQDVYQRAIAIQATLMMTAKSEKVRTDAANSLMVHLKQPEASKIHLDVRVEQDDSIRELKEATLELVRAQKLNIEAGTNTAEDIAKSKVITGEFETVGA